MARPKSTAPKIGNPAKANGKSRVSEPKPKPTVVSKSKKGDKSNPTKETEKTVPTKKANKMQNNAGSSSTSKRPSPDGLFDEDLEMPAPPPSKKKKVVSSPTPSPEPEAPCSPSSPLSSPPPPEPRRKRKTPPCQPSHPNIEAIPANNPEGHPASSVEDDAEDEDDVVAEQVKNHNNSQAREDNDDQDQEEDQEEDEDENDDEAQETLDYFQNPEAAAEAIAAALAEVGSTNKYVLPLYMRIYAANTLQTSLHEVLATF